MKFRALVVVSIVTLLATVGLADAKSTGGKKSHGVKGTIATVDSTKNTFTMTVGGKKNAGQTITVSAANATITINGTTGAFNALASGQKVVVVGTRSGDTLAATTITESAHKGKKSKTA